MSTNKANIHKLNSEFNHYYQTIVVAFDIENIVLITYIINAIKDDNRAVNLHWVTKTGNMNNPLTRKKISESKKGTPQPKGIDNKRSRTILQYTLDGKFIKEWHGSKEIARAFNGCNSFILKCCRGIYHQAYGYIWKFKEGD